MKALLIILSLCLPAGAQLPEQINDTPTMENQEFLLQKINTLTKNTTSSKSSQLTFGATTSSMSFTHGIDGTPSRVSVSFICTSSTDGYATNDEFELLSSTSSVTIWKNSTLAGISMLNPSKISYYPRDLGTSAIPLHLRTANWKLIFRAWK